MAFDAHKNLAIASVVTAPSPATTGTTLVVGAGQGARFGAVPFNATVWPIDMAPDPATAEVVRVTAIAGDTLTIVRAQEGTTARAIVAGDLFAATITAKSLTDIESGVNFPLITTPGLITGSSGARLSGGAMPATGPTAVELSVAAGEGYINVYDRTAALYRPLSFYAQDLTYFAGGIRGKMHNSGGFSWGSTTDPGAGNLSVLGNVLIGGDKAIIRTTNDGADNGYLQLGGGGAATPDRGGHINLFGNEFAAYPGGGTIQLVPGNAGVGGKIEFYSGNATLRGTVHPSGGFSWGGTGDPGAASLMVGSAVSTAAGQSYAHIGSLGTIQLGIAGTAATVRMNFENANGSVGTIIVSGTTTQYNTTSDARLKTPLNRHTDPSVLRDTVIHDFVWKSDGTAGRGVFAQEAQAVAPFAVSVGTDERDEEGRLKNPWGVDYSKYVPDLITGWQVHDAGMDSLAARVSRLELAAVGMPAYQSPHGGAMMLQRVRDWMDRIRAWVFPKESPCV